MRDCKKNKRSIYRAKLIGKEEILYDGQRTGSYDLKYSKPEVVDFNVVSTSSIRNLAYDMRGLVEKYELVLVTSEPTNIDTTDVFWVFSDPKLDAYDFVVGGKLFSLNSTIVGLSKA